LVIAYLNFENYFGFRYSIFEFWFQRSRTNRHSTLAFPTFSQPTLGGAPRFGRVTQPGLRNRTPPTVSSRGTWVWPCRNTSQSVGGLRAGGGMCCRRNRVPFLVRSTVSGHSKLLSQLPRTRVTGGPISFNSSKMLGSHTSPRCQISLACRAISLTDCGNLLCVSARTKILVIPSEVEGSRGATFEFSQRDSSVRAGLAFRFASLKMTNCRKMEGRAPRARGGVAELRPPDDTAAPFA
jgi:hypothetical protein